MSTLTQRLNEERKARLVRLGSIKAEPVVAEPDPKIIELTNKLDAAYADLARLNATVVSQRVVIKKLSENTQTVASALNDILMATAEHFQVTRAMIMGRSLAPAIVAPRRVIYYLGRQAGYSYPQIGRACGKNHTSVMYGIRQVDACLEKYSEAIEGVQERIAEFVAMRERAE